MIRRCFTSDTNIFKIKSNRLIKNDPRKEDKLHAIAEKISNETGVPKELIYNGPGFFYIDHWHKIDSEWYFFKTDGFDRSFVHELLGEVISEYFGLDTVHYKVAELDVKGKDKKYGVASKNFCDKSLTYKRIWDYLLEFDFPIEGLSILEKIKIICPKDETYLLLKNDLMKLFTRDFYVSQGDRTGNNFLFKWEKDNVRLAPLYDYEAAFSIYRDLQYKNQIGELNLRDKTTCELIRKDEKFQELFYLLMDADMDDFVKGTEERHKIIIPSEMKDHFIKHEGKIKQLVLDSKVIK